MTPFVVGQQVSFPSLGHTTRGVVRRVYVDENGAEWCDVRGENGIVQTWRADALYANAETRAAAQAAMQAERVHEDKAARQAFVLSPPQGV